MVRQGSRLLQRWGNNNKLFQCKGSTSLLRHQDWSKFSKTTWKKVQKEWQKRKGTREDGEAYRLESVWDCLKCCVCKDGTSNTNMITEQMVGFFAFGSVNLGVKHLF